MKDDFEHNVMIEFTVRCECTVNQQEQGTAFTDGGMSFVII